MWCSYNSQCIKGDVVFPLPDSSCSSACLASVYSSSSIICTRIQRLVDMYCVGRVLECPMNSFPNRGKVVILPIPGPEPV